MIVAPCFSKLIRDSRKHLRLSQKDVCSQVQITQGRLSLLECGHRAPTPSEQESLSSLLSIPLTQLRAAVPSTPRPTLSKIRKQFAPWRPFKVPKDRSSEVRYHAARRSYPQLVAKLTRKLVLREDIDWIRIYLREACFDSGLEFLFSLVLLDAGAKPGWVSPQHAGFVHSPIINPATRTLEGHLQRPALGWEEFLLFPQVSVRTQRMTVTLDALLGVSARARPRWWDLELDGTGHDSTSDQHRELELGLPTLRFREHEVLNASCVQRIRELRE